LGRGRQEEEDGGKGRKRMRRRVKEDENGAVEDGLERARRGHKRLWYRVFVPLWRRRVHGARGAAKGSTRAHTGREEERRRRQKL